MLEGGPGDAVDTAGKKRERARDVSLVTTADWVTVYWFSFVLDTIVAVQWLLGAHRSVTTGLVYKTKRGIDTLYYN